MVTNINYSQSLDDYFHQIGYPVMGQICAFSKLFTGPYSATSIRDFFATGFDCFLGEEMLVRNFLRLFTILSELTKLEEQ